MYRESGGKRGREREVVRERVGQRERKGVRERKRKRVQSQWVVTHSSYP